MNRYLGQLLERLQEKGFGGSFLMILSDGALTTLDQAKRYPIRLAEGGPAGGVALGAHVAREVGSDRTLSLDIGGTTAKICFIENGRPQTTRLFEVARAWRDVKGSGLPVKVPTVELVEIGAGGGSIAHIDELDRLRIGPQSAGSEPGPAAYDKGGRDATVTDAHLTVGNIAAEGFAGGMIKLAPERAPEAVALHVRPALGDASVEAAAAGVIELADETMANAARVHGVELGLDISRFDLLVSGGGGGLHCARIAEKLGIRRIIVPQDAGVGSAVGFLRSPVAYESAISVMEPLAETNIDELAEKIAEARADVRDIVAKAVPADRVELDVTAELRYQGQGLQIAIRLPREVDFTVGLHGVEARFLDRYRSLVGFVLEDIPIELVSLSVRAQQRENLTKTAKGDPGPAVASQNARQIYDLGTRDPLRYAVIDRGAIHSHVVEGPCVVPEAQTTTLVRPGWSVCASEHGHLVLERTTP